MIYYNCAFCAEVFVHPLLSYIYTAKYFSIKIDFCIYLTEMQHIFIRPFIRFFKIILNYKFAPKIYATIHPSHRQKC